MTSLANRHCKAPSKTDQPLGKDGIEALMGELDDAWQADQSGERISRDFTFKNFYETVAFVNALAWIANREDHHPDLEVSYKHCVVHFSTHAIGGLSENDFICAAKADALL